MKSLTFGLFTFLVFAPQMATAQSAPIVVLEYPTHTSGGSDNPGLNLDNPFVSDPNYSVSHRVMPDETLSHIITEHYAGSGLDLSVVQMAIVKKNSSAFVRGNPNFLYADKLLRLPSLNEMKNLVLGAKQHDQTAPAASAQDHIYFIGG